MWHDQTDASTTSGGTTADVDGGTRRRPEHPASGPGPGSGRRAGVWTMAVAMAVTATLGLGACGSDGEGAAGSGGERQVDDGGDRPAGDVDTTEGAPDGATGDGSDPATDGESAASDVPSSCGLIETPEIEEQFGGPVDVLEEGASCRWQVGTDPTAAPSGLLALTLEEPEEPGQSAEDLFSAFVDGHGVTEDQMTAGIGDEAYFYPAANSVVLRSGDRVYSLVSRFNTDIADIRPRMETLAEQAAGRL